MALATFGNSYFWERLVTPCLSETQKFGMQFDSHRPLTDDSVDLTRLSYLNSPQNGTLWSVVGRYSINWTLLWRSSPRFLGGDPMPAAFYFGNFGTHEK